jgi:hypothetical protein
MAGRVIEAARASSFNRGCGWDIDAPHDTEIKTRRARARIMRVACMFKILAMNVCYVDIASLQQLNHSLRDV